MDEIVTEHVGSILRVQLNRPTKRNAMTSAIYIALAGIFSEAANDENTRVILWHGAGDSFCAGNDIGDFLKNPPGPGESPQASMPPRRRAARSTVFLFSNRSIALGGPVA
jgi:enoyl-CoA hydratase/carnithine racemase